MTTCRNTYGGYGSYLRSRGYDKAICLLATDIENGTVKAGAIDIKAAAVNVLTSEGTATGSIIQYNPATGSITYTPSSRRYKTDFQDTPLEHANKLLQIKSKNYFYKTNAKAQQTGFIAEELDEIDYLKRFVVYNSEGLPEAVRYDQMIAPLLELVRDNKNHITDLEAQLKTALDRITALENK